MTDTLTQKFSTRISPVAKRPLDFWQQVGILRLLTKMKLDKNKQEKQEKAFAEIFKIAEDAGLDLISVRDEDILYALENEKDILEKLTPEICSEIRSNIVNIISEEYYKFIAEAVALQFPDEDIAVSEEELNSPEAQETSEEDETKA